MNDLKNLTTVIIRLQAMSFILMAIVHWALVLTEILINSLKSASHQVVNYEPYLILSFLYLLIGVVLWIRSRSLADYFIRSVPDSDE